MQTKMAMEDTTLSAAIKHLLEHSPQFEAIPVSVTNGSDLVIIRCRSTPSVAMLLYFPKKGEERTIQNRPGMSFKTGANGSNQLTFYFADAVGGHENQERQFLWSEVMHVCSRHGITTICACLEHNEEEQRQPFLRIINARTYSIFFAPQDSPAGPVIDTGPDRRLLLPIINKQPTPATMAA